MNIEDARIKRALRTLLQGVGLRSLHPAIGVTDDEGEKKFDAGVPGIFVRAQDSGSPSMETAPKIKDKLNKAISVINQYFEAKRGSLIRATDVYLRNETEQFEVDKRDPELQPLDRMPNNALIVDAAFFSVPHNLEALERLASELLTQRSSFFTR